MTKGQTPREQVILSKFMKHVLKFQLAHQMTSLHSGVTNFADARQKDWLPVLPSRARKLASTLGWRSEHMRSQMNGSRKVTSLSVKKDKIVLENTSR